MKTARLWLGISLLLPLVAPGIAQANIFAPPVAPRLRGADELDPRTTTRFKRFLVGAYAAKWSFADQRIPRAGVSESETEISPLFTADYFITDRFSVGGWVNFVSSESRLNGRKIGEGDTTFWDVHATYYLRHDLSVQAGVSHISEDFTFTRNVFSRREPGTVVVPRGRKVRGERGAFNVWATKSQRIIGGDHPVTIYGSLGYYADDDFSYATNAIFGGSVGITPNISLSASSWWFNLGGEIENRISLGLTGRF